MPTLTFGRAYSVVLGLVVLAAAAPAAGAQSHPRWQVEASLDHTGSEFMHSVFAETATGGAELSQMETVRYSVGASRLARLAGQVNLRIGLSLSNKGFTEESTRGGETSERHVDLLYLGAPITLGYNLANGSRGIRPFVEAGIVPELLLRQDESAFEMDLRRTGVSYLASVGAKYNLGDGRAIVLAPEIRIGARKYSRDTPGTVEYRPITTGIKLGVQF